jgi:NADH:ubiquinone oxidoreductase subunit 2 (subunit N)
MMRRSKKPSPPVIHTPGECRLAVDPHLVVTSVAGLFCYLRIVVALYSAPPEQAVSIPGASPGTAGVLVVLAIFLTWFGVYPTPLLNLIRKTVAGLN